MPLPPHQKAHVNAQTVWLIGFNLAALGLLLMFLYSIRTVLALLLGAAFLVLIFNPIVVRMERRGIRRWVAVLFITFIGALALGAVLVLFIPLLAEQGEKLANAAPDLLNRLRAAESVQRLDDRFHVFERLRVESADHLGRIMGSMLAFVTQVARVLLDVGVVLVLAILMLIFGETAIAALLGVLTPSRRFHLLRIGRRMQEMVGGYVAGVLVVAAAGGTVITIALALVGVPFFLPLGVAMFVLGLLPFVGPLLAAFVIVGATLAARGFWPGVVMAGIFLAYQMMENHLLQPLVQRRTIRMNPLIIALALLTGGTLAGVIGAIFALPVAGAVQVVLREYLVRQRGGPMHYSRSRKRAAAALPTAPQRPGPPRPSQDESRG